MGVNAVTSVPTYTDGEILEASRLNVTNSGIPVFATTTTRDAAFGGTGEKVLAEGQYAYIEASNTTQYYDGANWVTLGGKIAQIVSASKTDTFSSTSIPYVDITGLSVSITPSSASNKVLVLAVVEIGITTGGVDPFLRLVRGSTAIDVGDAAGNRTQASAGGRSSGVADAQSNVMMFLDSPATTSATTYKVQLASNTGVVVYVNRSSDDGNIAERGRYASSITVMEIFA